MFVIRHNVLFISNQIKLVQILSVQADIKIINLIKDFSLNSYSQIPGDPG